MKNSVTNVQLKLKKMKNKPKLWIPFFKFKFLALFCAHFLFSLPSLYLVRMKLRSNQQVLDTGQHPQHLTPRHRLSSKLRRPVSRWQVRNLLWHVVPIFLAQGDRNFHPLSLVRLTTIGNPHSISTLIVTSSNVISVKSSRASAEGP